MNKVAMLTKLNTKINKLKMKGRKYSPELLLILGIAGAVTGTILACVATTKLPEVKAKKEEELADMHARLDIADDEKGSEVSPEIKKETTAIYLKAGMRYAGLYAPAVLVSGVSLSCLVVSNVILRKRLIGVSAAYATIAQSFREYRNRVADKYGEDAERDIRYNIQPKEITTVTTDTNGNEKEKKETIKVANPDGYSDFARVFDEGCISWSKDPQANLIFLKCQQTAATERLRRNGYLFLNDVYEMLGFQKTKEGQAAGWVYNEEHPIGDNYVDFGIYDITRERVRDFINGYERNIILDFNIDGNVLEFM